MERKEPSFLEPLLTEVSCALSGDSPLLSFVWVPGLILSAPSTHATSREIAITILSEVSR